MKVKQLLLFLLVLGFASFVRAQSTEPYNHLIITEARLDGGSLNYLEITNKGDKSIDLSEIEFGRISPWWQDPWVPEEKDVSDGLELRMLAKKILAPGESYVIATAFDFGPEMWKASHENPLYPEISTQPEMGKLANELIHFKELNSVPGLDSITPHFGCMDWSQGREGTYLRHHFINASGEKDSMIIDQVNVLLDSEGSPTGADEGNKAVAGESLGAWKNILIRRNYVTTGITDFSSHDANVAAANLAFEHSRGVGLDDSQWIPVPFLSDYDVNRAVFWTVGNSVSAELNGNTLTPKSGSKVKVDNSNGVITVPWGIRNNDSIMYQFLRKPGLAWHYAKSTSVEDSAYTSIRSGDLLTLYVCGDQLTKKQFTLAVNNPTVDDNKVISKSTINYLPKKTVWGNGPFFNYISDGVKGMDTISRLGYATRVDTLFKYLEKPSKANWKVIFKSGVAKPDLISGDILRVTSESGKVKDYYLKLHDYKASGNAYLSAITWPDMPDWFKGDLSKAYNWKGDTIPSFNVGVKQYVVNIPLEYDGIPALAFTKESLNSKVSVIRAKTLRGSVADRTVTFTVTSESDTIVNVYTVVFEKEKDPINTQTWIGEPFISRYYWWDAWDGNLAEIYNPSTEPLDLSSYMFVSNTWGETTLADIFAWHSTDFESRYTFYIPGRKWASEAADFEVTPYLVQPDLATNAIVSPGDVFTMSGVGYPEWLYYETGQAPYRDVLDIDFSAGRCPWKDAAGNEEVVGQPNALSNYQNGVCYLLKIVNDSVKNGLKPATDINDFEIIDTWGMADLSVVKFNGVKIDGTPDPASSVEMEMVWNNERRPNIYKGNPVLGANLGTDWETCEWTFKNPNTQGLLGYTWPIDYWTVWTGVGTHIANEVTIGKSTVTSQVYKVSSGYSDKETIQGLKTGVTLEGFYANIVKANPLQTLKVMSGDAEVPAANAVKNGDVLVVLSSDSVNTSKYILDVTANGLSSNALLTSATYTISASGTAGTVGGFAPGTLLKDVLAGVNVPAGATLTITDANDAYMSLSKLNYDTAYVNVIATDMAYFNVVAENGMAEIVYQLMPTSSPSDAWVTSDVYSVDQDAALIQYLPGGTTVISLMVNVTPAPGASFQIIDKANLVRESGSIYKDDKLVVTSKDGKTKKAYYFSMLDNQVSNYLAYVTSSKYKVDQLALTIKMTSATPTKDEFYSSLEPSFGATMMTYDNLGNISASNVISVGEKLKVTAADNSTITWYEISSTVGIGDLVAELIKMYPNPTTDRVVIQGLAKGNRVRVFNSTGITLRDVTVNNSTEYVSLAGQPAGIYVFVISSGEKFINIQKIVKK